MWFRSDLKTSGKTAFYRNYWTVVLVALIVMIASGGAGNRGSQANRTYRETVNQYNDFDYDDFGYSGSSSSIGYSIGSAVAGLIFSVIFLVIMIVVLVLKILVGNNLFVGGKRFFMENREHRTPVGAVTYSFKNGYYGNVMLTMFLRDLYTFLWTLLLIVPGIIKSYEYRMVPYLLSENPQMDRRRAFELSRRMMDGQKMDTFILDLSFIGWGILGTFTCGILNIFFVSPYIYATEAELYAVLRSHALQTGVTNTNELPGYSFGYC